MYACRPRVMRLSGMEVFLLRSPFHTVGKNISFFFFALFLTFGSSFFFSCCKSRWLGWESSPIQTPIRVCVGLLRFLLQFLLNFSPSSLLTGLTTDVSNLHCVNNMKNGSAEDSGIHLAFCVHQFCVYVRVKRM